MQHQDITGLMIKLSDNQASFNSLARSVGKLEHLEPVDNQPKAFCALNTLRTHVIASYVTRFTFLSYNELNISKTYF